MIVVVSLWTASLCFSFMFACKGNFSAWWLSASSLIANCINTLQLLFAFAVSDFVTDVIVLTLPIPSVCPMTTRTEFTLMIIGRRLTVAHASKIWCVVGLYVRCTVRIGSPFINVANRDRAVVASMIRMIWVIWARNVGFDPSLDEDRELSSRSYNQQY
jgi:hypothetical protein